MGRRGVLLLDERITFVDTFLPSQRVLPFLDVTHEAGAIFSLSTTERLGTGIIEDDAAPGPPDLRFLFHPNFCLRASEDTLSRFSDTPFASLSSRIESLTELLCGTVLGGGDGGPSRAKGAKIEETGVGP